jgi:glycosyltransferase involved in cell wall biosynthesis
MSARGARRILQITVCPFPPEIRVVKEGVSLAEAGYQSAVLCPPIAGRPERETWRGIQVFRPAPLRSAAKVGDKLAYHAAFFSPAWYRAIRQVLAEYQPEVIHVHDIWLGRTVFLARRQEKVVMDLHENMPAAVVEYLGAYRGVTKLFHTLFKGRARVLRYERALLRDSDRVLVVVEEALHRVLEEHPSLNGKVVNVENLESKAFVARASASPRVIESDHFSLLYIGGFGPHRGIDTLIAAMQHVKAWGLDVRLYLVGAREGSDYVRMLKDLIRDLDVGSHVSVIGWVPSEQVLAYISQASAGAVPHHSNPHNDNTIPHKLYQYMIAGTPVFASTSLPLERTVRSANAGVIFKAGDVLDCAQKIREMASDPARLKVYAENGRRYVLQQGHNWEEEASPALIETYDRLLGVAA